MTTKEVLFRGTDRDTYAVIVKVQEVWSTIDGFSRYEVSSWGRVRNAKSRRILKPRTSFERLGNRLEVRIFSNDGDRTSLYVHDLVAAAFVPNPFGFSVVDHIDKVRSNNHSWNLIWSTPEYLKSRHRGIYNSR